MSDRCPLGYLLFNFLVCLAAEKILFKSDYFETPKLGENDMSQIFMKL